MTRDDEAEQHQRRGAELLRDGRLDEGVAEMARAVALRPEAAHLHANLALAWLAAGRVDEALESYDRAVGLEPDLALRPRSAEILSACGQLLLQADRPAEARPRFEAAVAVAPTPERLGNLSAAALALGAYAEALAAAERALSLLGEGPDASLASRLQTNRGAALVGLDRPAEGRSAADGAVAADPGNALAHNLRGVADLALGRLEAAIGGFSAAIDLGEGRLPASRVAEFTLNRALARLQLGDFAAGWRDYAARWQVPAFVASANVPERLRTRLALGLQPADIAGRRVLVVGEQGVGDELMFASLLPDLLRIARKVAIVCQPKLARLLAGAFPEVQVLSAAPADLGGFELVVAAGDLGGAFRRRPEAFPGSAYVRPSPEAVEHWRGRLGPRRKRLRVGLSWRGGAPGTNTARRSMPLSALRPLLAAPDLELVSLQYGEAGAEVAAARAEGADVQAFPPEETQDLDDLAGLIRNLDLVVTVQNTTVHLCGALGQPCLAMVPARPEWRYAAASTAMPWYRSVRLFRQDETAAWDPVIRRVVDAVAEVRAPEP